MIPGFPELLVSLTIQCTLLADGPVRVVTDTIDSVVYRQMARRQD